MPARHRLVVTAEDGIAEGGVGALVASALARLDDVAAADRGSLTLGTPLEYLPQGKPAAILASLGIDGPGIAATVQKALDTPA